MGESRDDDSVLVFVPPLVSLLLAAERSKGAALSEPEVLDVRDSATCIRLGRSTAAGMAEARGYDDIEPERCWEEWQVVRTLVDG